MKNKPWPFSPAQIARVEYSLVADGHEIELTRWEVALDGRAMEFPSYDAALACYRSPEYQAAKALRKGSAEADIVALEGYDGG